MKTVTQLLSSETAPEETKLIPMSIAKDTSLIPTHCPFHNIQVAKFLDIIVSFLLPFVTQTKDTVKIYRILPLFTV